MESGREKMAQSFGPFGEDLKGVPSGGSHNLGHGDDVFVGDLVVK
jgi:hypothetical protein